MENLVGDVIQFGLAGVISSTWNNDGGGIILRSTLVILGGFFSSGICIFSGICICNSILISWWSKIFSNSSISSWSLRNIIISIWLLFHSSFPFSHYINLNNVKILNPLKHVILSHHALIQYKLLKALQIVLNITFFCQFLS